MKMNKASFKVHGGHGTQKASADTPILDRPDSSVTKLCDLHVYKVPSELWRDNFNNVLNSAVTETVSVGIIRVPAELRLLEVRDQIAQQLSMYGGGQLVPSDYVFLRSVGRSLTTLRGKQEHQLKVKHFLPPVADAPELYILEATPEVKEALETSNGSSPALSRRESPQRTDIPTSHHNSYKGNHSPSNSRLSQDGLRDKHHRADLDHTSRVPRGNHSERYHSGNDSEEEHKWEREYGDFSKPRRKHHKHLDEDEQELSSDEDHSQESRRHKPGSDNNHLLKNVEETKQSRLDQEKERMDLLRKAKHIQQKTTTYRNEARDMWKKKYFEEKKKTAPLEDTIGILQAEMEALHRKHINVLEGPREKNLRMFDGGPSDKNNHVIQCVRLRHEIEDLSRRVDIARTKLTSEMKLRVQAQAEMKVVRNEAIQNRLAQRMPRAHQGRTALVAAGK